MKKIIFFAPIMFSLSCALYSSSDNEIFQFDEEYNSCSPLEIAENCLTPETFEKWKQFCLDEAENKKTFSWKYDHKKTTFSFEILVPVWVKYSQPNDERGSHDTFAWMWNHTANEIIATDGTKTTNRGHPTINTICPAKDHDVICTLDTANKRSTLTLESPSAKKNFSYMLQLQNARNLSRKLTNTEEPLYQTQENLITCTFDVNNGKITQAIIEPAKLQNTHTHATNIIVEETTYGKKYTGAKNKKFKNKTYTDTSWSIQSVDKEKDASKDKTPYFQTRFINGVLRECITRIPKGNKLIITKFKKDKAFYGVKLKDNELPRLRKVKEIKKRQKSPNSPVHDPSKFLEHMQQVKNNPFYMEQIEKNGTSPQAL